MSDITPTPGISRPAGQKIAPTSLRPRANAERARTSSLPQWLARQRQDDDFNIVMSALGGVPSSNESDNGTSHATAKPLGAGSGERSAQHSIAAGAARPKPSPEQATAIINQLLELPTKKLEKLTGDESLREQATDALAVFAAASPMSPDSATYEAYKQRASEVFDHPDAVELIGNLEVPTQQRVWALSQVLLNPSWSSADLAAGWESPTVAKSFATQAFLRYAQRGTEADWVSGEGLRNYLGQALHLPPNRLPDNNESAHEEAMRLAAGLQYKYYEDSDAIDRIALAVQNIAGDTAQVQVLPALITSNEFGASIFPVFRVKNQDRQDHYVDHFGKTYQSIGDWSAANRGTGLPNGLLTFDADMDLTSSVFESVSAPANIDTFQEYVRVFGDYTAKSIGIAAACAAITGTGGFAAATAIAGSSLFIGGRATSDQIDLHKRGIDILDFTHGEVRANWLDVASGALSTATTSTIFRLSNATMARTAAPEWALNNANRLLVAEEVLDFTGMINSGYALASEWENLSTAERVAEALSLAFWAGGLSANLSRNQQDIDLAVNYNHLRDAHDNGTLPRSLTRGDSYAWSHQARNPGEFKTHIDADGNLSPADNKGLSTPIEHVYGNEPQKSASPYTSFTGDAAIGEAYGDYQIELDAERLRADLLLGDLTGVELIEHDELIDLFDDHLQAVTTQWHTDRAPASQSQMNEAIRVRSKALRDGEFLVKGTIPREYFVVSRPN